MIENYRQASRAVVTIDENTVPLERIVDIAVGRATVAISDSPSFVETIERSRTLLQNALDDEVAVYGVTTGYGGSCGNRFERSDIEELGRNLIRYHGCGTGEDLGVVETRAAMVSRLLCISRGYSGVSMGLLQQIADFLNHGITPCVPCQGSVGASGDLTPMSYVAAALTGERDVIYRGNRVPAMDAMRAAGVTPYRYGPKEPLAMLNGTSVMTGIATLAIDRARRILRAAAWATAASVHGLGGHAHHFHKTIFEAKPFSGQGRVASALRELLDTNEKPPESADLAALQDPYSIRCAPQILGVLSDALDWIAPWVETEANSANDNPLVDPESGEVLMGGNFYGGHIAFAMDGLKTAVAHVADMADRQIALLVDARFSRGLPGNLASPDTANPCIHHGFKGIQITASALTAEVLKNATPASLFSRSTESHNQDKVSMGTIAARDALKACSLTERTVAIHLMTAAQACRLRGSADSRPALLSALDSVERFAPPVQEDRPLDADLERVAAAVADGSLFGKGDVGAAD